MSDSKCKIIFFGTPAVAVSILEALTKANFCDVVAVVTQPDRAMGRHHSMKVPSPVKIAAQKAKIPVLEGLDGPSLSNTTPRIKACPDESHGYGAGSNPSSKRRGFQPADLGIVVAYGEILPKRLLDHFPLGIVNIHPSLLPKYRGPSPVQAAILNRDSETGVSVIKLDEEMDHGPIIAQEKVSLRVSRSETKQSYSRVKEDVSDNNLNRDDRIASADGHRLRNDMMAGELGDYLFKIGAELLIKVLPDYIAGRLIPRPQDDSRASYTKKLTKEDGKIDWSRSPEQIHAHIRAMNPWPGAWMEWREKRLIVWRASYPHPTLSLEGRGNIKKSPLLSEERVRACPERSEGVRSRVQLEEVQLAGKKKMPFKEFLKGRPDFTLTPSSPK